MHDLSAREIITEWSRGRDIPPLSSEEMLAMAYNEMARRLQEAYAEVRKVEAELASVVHQRAVDVTINLDLKVSTIKDPTVWRLRLEPMTVDTRMLSAHPSRWSSAAIHGVTEQVSQIFTGMIMERLYDMREEAERPLPAPPEQEQKT